MIVNGGNVGSDGDDHNDKGYISCENDDDDKNYSDNDIDGD